MSKRQHLLTHPFFLLALLVLLCNDLWWKYQFHNTLTGKLSDVAGLFVFSVFLWVIVGKRKHLLFIATAIIFVWWKSPLSESFIEGWNGLAPFTLHRTIDFSDCLALFVLPLSSAYCNIKALELHHIWRKLAFGASLFAILASSSDDIRFVNPMTGTNNTNLAGCSVTVERSGKKALQYNIHTLSDSVYAVTKGSKDTVFKGELVYNDGLYFANKPHPLYPDQYTIILAFEQLGDSIRNFESIFSAKPYALVNTKEVEKKRWFKEVDVIWSEADDQNIIIIENTEAETLAAFRAVLERAPWRLCKCNS